MSYTIIDGLVVDTNTGEIITPKYEVFDNTPSAEERKYYRDTRVGAYDCTDPEQLKDHVKAVCDMRGVRLQSDIRQFKLENDAAALYGTKTQLNKNQVEGIKALFPLVVYNNIVLCSREELSDALGVKPKDLARKLKQLQPYVQQHPAKTGFVKLFIHPSMAFKGRGGKENAIKHFYKRSYSDVIDNLLNPPDVPPLPPILTDEQLERCVISIASNQDKKPSAFFDEYGYEPDEFEMRWMKQVRLKD